MNKNFDIKAHLQNHAYYFKQNAEITSSDLHFNFSYLDIQFFNQNKRPEEILKELLDELKKETEYKVLNGWRTLKNGEKVQKYTTRKINLANAIKIEAIHIEGADGEYTMPHIHLILDKNARLGKNYSLLKEHIAEISKKFNLKPNFAEVPINNPQTYRNLGKSVKNFSWIIRKMPNSEFKNYINKPNFVDKLQKLYDYTLLSGNLQYYIKTMNYIRKRLQNLKMDKKVILRGKEFNLREFYPLPLTEQDKKVIDLINEKKFSQKDLKPHLKSPILRDFIRYSYFKDKKKALIIKELTEQTTLLNNIRPNSKAVNNFVKLYTKHELPLTREKAIQKNIETKKNESIKEILKKDLLQVAKSCKNEKELRQEMQKLGYKEFGFKKKSGKVYGYQFIPPNESKKIVIKCKDTIPISDIRAILKENYLKYKATLEEPQKTQIQSNISVYTLPKENKPQQKLLPVLYKSDFKLLKEETKKLKELSEQKLSPLPKLIPQIRIELPQLKLTINKEKILKKLQNNKYKEILKEIKYKAKAINLQSQKQLKTTENQAFKHEITLPKINISINKEKILNQAKRSKYANLIKQIDYQATILKIRSKQKLIPKNQAFKEITLPKLNITLTIPKEKIKQRRKYGKTIAKYIGAIERNAKQLATISKREFRTERKSARIRSKTQLFRERITNAIRETITKSANTIATEFKQTIGRISKRLKIAVNPLKYLEELKKKYQKLIERRKEIEYDDDILELNIPESEKEKLAKEREEERKEIEKQKKAIEKERDAIKSDPLLNAKIEYLKKKEQYKKEQEYLKELKEFYKNKAKKTIQQQKTTKKSKGWSISR